MDLSLTREGFESDDQSWLGSAHGTDMARSVTLDVSTFTKATHYPRGWLPSGTALKKAANGLYGLGDATAADCAGFLLDPLRVRDGATRVAGAIYAHGRVVGSKLPIPVDASAHAAVGAIQVV